jgi:hypothetical protein
MTKRKPVFSVLTYSLEDEIFQKICEKPLVFPEGEHESGSSAGPYPSRISIDTDQPAVPASSTELSHGAYSATVSTLYEYPKSVQPLNATPKSRFGSGSAGFEESQSIQGANTTTPNPERAYGDNYYPEITQQSHSYPNSSPNDGAGRPFKPAESINSSSNCTDVLIGPSYRSIFSDISTIILQTEKVVLEVMSLMKLPNIGQRFINAVGREENAGNATVSFMEDIELDKMTLRDIIKPAMRIFYRVIRLDKFVHNIVCNSMISVFI